MPNSTLHAKSKIALVEAEWAHFTTARSEHAARRVMAAHLLLRYALIVCLFFIPVKGTAALFAYAQKSGTQRQPVCAIHRRAANCSSMCRHWSGCRSRPMPAAVHHSWSVDPSKGCPIQPYCYGAITLGTAWGARLAPSIQRDKSPGLIARPDLG